MLASGSEHQEDARDVISFSPLSHTSRSLAPLTPSPPLEKGADGPLVVGTCLEETTSVVVAAGIRVAERASVAIAAARGPLEDSGSN